MLTVKKCSPLVRLERAVTAAASRSATSRRLARPVDVGADDDELVAAEPRDGVGGAQRGGQPGRQREQHLVAGGVAERVVDELEAVEVEHEDGDVDALALAAGQRLVEAVERERAVRQAGERIVQRGMAGRLLAAVALDRDDDQRRDRGEERDLVLGEDARLARVDVEHPERLVVALDRDAEAADDAELEQRRRRREARLGRQVLDDRRLAGAQHVCAPALRSGRAGSRARRAGPSGTPTVATGLSRSPASSSSSTRPISTPSVAAAVRTASVISSPRSWLPSAKRPSAATALCWRARRPSCCSAFVRSVTSRATTSSDSTVPSSAWTGTAWTANVSPSLVNSKVRRSPCSAAR